MVEAAEDKKHRNEIKTLNLKAIVSIALIPN
jgi:hypothetical protein